MKKLMTVRETREFCEKNRPHCVLFYTENQDWYEAADPCKFRLSFPIMLIHENPNLICLKSGASTISFDRVKSVEVDTNTTVLGTIYKITCGDFASDDGDITYTLVAK